MSSSRLDARSHRGFAWFSFPLAAIAGAFLWLFAAEPGTPTLRTTDGWTRLEPPLALAEFHLTRDDGTPLGRETLEGRWTLLSIGFASCPDVCPLTLGILGRAAETADPTGRDVLVLFVSVDPERDEPERLHAYVGHFGRSVVGATGSHEQLRRLVEPLGLFYATPVTDATGTRSEVEHSTTVVVIDPKGQAVGLIGSHDRDAETVVSALARLRGTSS